MLISDVKDKQLLVILVITWMTRVDSFFRNRKKQRFAERGSGLIFDLISSIEDFRWSEAATDLLLSRINELILYCFPLLLVFCRAKQIRQSKSLKNYDEKCLVSFLWPAEHLALLWSSVLMDIFFGFTGTLTVFVQFPKVKIHFFQFYVATFLEGFYSYS